MAVVAAWLRRDATARWRLAQATASLRPSYALWTAPEARRCYGLLAKQKALRWSHFPTSLLFFGWEKDPQDLSGLQGMLLCRQAPSLEEQGGNGARLHSLKLIEVKVRKAPLRGDTSCDSG